MCHCLFHLLVLAVIAAASLVFIVAIKEKALFMTTQAYRASILHFPKKSYSPKKDYVYFDDGILVTRNGKIEFTGEYKSYINQYPEANINDCSNKLILPGFIDSHLHFPQTEMLASFGQQLLDWLKDYTFPVERKFANYDN